MTGTTKTMKVRAGTVIRPMRHIHGKYAYFKVRRFGVNLFFARSRQGKSSIAKNLLCQIARFRPILVIDYRGEYAGMELPNFKSNDLMLSIPNLYTVEDFALLLTDLQTSDWVSLGFSEYSCKLMAKLSHEYISVHNNDPIAFSELLFKLPTSDQELAMFNEEYSGLGLGFDFRLPDVTKQSMISRFGFVKDYFLTLTDERDHIDNFGELMMKHPHVRLNLNIKSDSDMPFARCVTGIFLRQMIPFLKMLKPFIAIDEADALCPNLENAFYFPSSLDILRMYALKLQAHDVNLLFITQDENTFDKVIGKNWHQKFLGHGAEPREMTERLYWDYDRGIRQFLLMNENKQYVPFQSDEICCQLE